MDPGSFIGLSYRQHHIHWNDAPLKNTYTLGKIKKKKKKECQYLNFSECGNPFNENNIYLFVENNKG